MVYRSHRVGVVVPAYNESGCVATVIEALPGFVDRVYAVDDGSTDGTFDELCRCARNHRTGPPATPWPVRDGDDRALESRVDTHLQVGRVVLLRHGRNLGAGGAIKTGYLAAMRDDVDIVATLDGDGQMDPELLPRFLDPIVDGAADYTKGNRLGTPESRAEMSRVRLLGNVLLSALTRLSSGYWAVMDSQNGYTAIASDALERTDVEGLFEYYGYCNDLLAELNDNRMRVVDVPHRSRYADETSHIAFGTYVPKVSWLLLRNFWRRVRGSEGPWPVHPLAVLYAGSVAAGIAGVRYAVEAVLPSRVERPARRHRPVRAGASFAVAVGLFVVAIVVDIHHQRRRTGTVGTRPEVGSR